MHIPNAECMRDPELWEHLVQLTQIVNRSISGETRNCDSVELDKLRHENEALREENKQLHERLKKFEFWDVDREMLAEYKKERLSGSERMLLTQETVLSEVRDDDPDLTDSSPVKSQNLGSFSNFFPSNNSQSRSSKRHFEDTTDDGIVKKVKTEPLNDDVLFNISQIDDSQEGNAINSTSILHTVLTKNNPDRCQKIDFTENPVLRRQWFPEDFMKNPEYEKYVNDRSKNRKTVPNHISAHFQRQQKHLQSLAMHDFNKLAMGTQNSEGYQDFESSDKENNMIGGTSKLVTPPQDCILNFRNSAISPMYKFEINKQNLNKYLKYFPNLLRTNKVRSWEVEDSAENDVCADFLLTQDVQEKNSRARERAQLRGLRMLFQACFVVENGTQLGAYIFRNKEFNEKVCKSEFVLDLSIFDS